jgi:tetratricopeptide (TPR) repeat protein
LQKSASKVLNHLRVENKLSKQQKKLQITLAIFICGIALLAMIYWAFQVSSRPVVAGRSTAEQMLEAALAVPRPTTDRLVYALQQRLRGNPKDSQLLAQLGSAYLQKARETGDPSYYVKAEQVFDTAIANDAQNAEALTGMGALCLARHEFKEALHWGKRAIAANQYKAAAFGVIGDARLELGRYDEAVEAIQKMVNLRPDLSSYSRVSYVRELMGDVAGAIEAMKLAISAGAPALENTNWCRVQLGNLYFNSGVLNAAEAVYQQALVISPDYAPALFGIARVRAAQDSIEEAIAILQTVTSSQPLPEYLIELGELYESSGKTEEAKRQYELVQALHLLQQDNGVQTDAELALFLADHDLDPKQALKHARAALQERPSIFADDVLAWALYKNGLYEEAARYIQKALRLGTQNALMFYHAGMIYYRLGDRNKAEDNLRAVMQINPHFSRRHVPKALKVLSELRSKTSSIDEIDNPVGL